MYQFISLQVTAIALFYWVEVRLKEEASHFPSGMLTEVGNVNSFLIIQSVVVVVVIKRQLTIRSEQLNVRDVTWVKRTIEVEAYWLLEAFATGSWARLLKLTC